MNYILPDQSNTEVKGLAVRRGRLLADEVSQAVRRCEQQTLGQSGFLTWTSLEGRIWGVFEEGRCSWLLVVDGQKDRVFYYRQRGDEESFELHEPGYGGETVCQRVEQIGLVIHSYQCETGCRLGEIQRKLRWWQLQNWMRELKNQVKERHLLSWLRKAA